MSIQALPESTTRRLGAAQALPSPSALVKELLDNAIDARATSIEVILAANTLDKIEVRDNGSGIAADDLEQVGKRGHTSKLTCFEELRTVGRYSLGFRGEALASACTMGEVTVTTRTEGDQAGTIAKLKPTGGIESRSSKSHPTGTTVCVSNLFSKYPVRKQNFVKQTSKTISEIKDLLQSYALARLHIRIGLKVLKHPKADWTYIPRPQDGLQEAAAKVAGKDVAAMCTEQTHHIQDRDEPHIMILALLAKPDADFSKIKGGCFISIDGRPLSCSRETVSGKIYSAYKVALKELASKRGQELCRDPFLCLAISCEDDSYDPNVEPAKDDVVFAGGSSIFVAMGTLFRSIYPPPPALPIVDPRTNIANESPASVLSEDNEIMLQQQVAQEAQKRVTAHPVASENDQDEDDARLLHGHPARGDSQAPFAKGPSSTKVANDIASLLNPWTISNKSAAMPPPPFILTSDATPRQQRQYNRPVTGPFHTPPASHGKSINHVLPHAPYNPSPFSALPSKPPPGQKTIESWLTHSDDESHFEGPPRPPSGLTVFDDDAPFGNSHERPRRQTSYRTEPEMLDVATPPSKQRKLGPAFVKAGSLSMGMNMTPPSSSHAGAFKTFNAFSRPSPGAHHAHPSSGDDMPMMSMDDEPLILGHPRHPLQAQLSPNGSEDGDSALSRGHRSSGYKRGRGGGAYSNKPFQSHRRKSTSKANAESHRRFSPGPDLPMMSLDDNEPVHGHPAPAPPLSDGDLIHNETPGQALNFEHRKVPATRRPHGENALRDLDPNTVMQGVGQAIDFEQLMLGRLNDIADDGQIIRNGDATIERQTTAFSEASRRPGTTIQGEDPRAYLMKRQRSMSRSGHKVKRMRTGLLPLETIPQAEEIHGLVLTMGIKDVNELNRQMRKLGMQDEYVHSGKYLEGLDMAEGEVEEVEGKIKRLMERLSGESQGSELLL